MDLIMKWPHARTAAQPGTAGLEDLDGTRLALWSTRRNGIKAWNAWCARQRRSSFWRPRLTGVDLTGARLMGADLACADVMGARLDLVNLADADLSAADIEGATLMQARLTGARMTDANLAHATLAGADLTGTCLAGACLVGADLRGTALVNASLEGADLTGASLDGADVRGATFSFATRFPGGLDPRSLLSTSPLASRGGPNPMAGSVNALSAGSAASLSGAYLHPSS